MPEGAGPARERLSAAGALRSLRVLLASSFLSTPLLAAATFLLVPLGQVQAQLSALWMKIVTDGVFRHDPGQALLGAILLAFSAAAFLLQELGTAKARLGLTERASFWLDRRTAELVATLPGLEHHEHPEYQDRLALLRDQRGMLGQGINALLNMLSVLGQVVLTVVLLATVSPWLLLVALPSALGFVLVPIQQRRWRATEERLAPNTLLDEVLYDLATTEAPAKELRVFEMGDDLLARFDSSWREVYAGNVRSARRSMLENAATYALPSMSVVGAVAFVALRAAHGAATPGDVMMAAALATQLSGSVSGVVQTSNWMLNVMRTVGRLLWLEDYASSAKLTPLHSGKAPTRLTDGIRLEGVCFAYPHGAGKHDPAPSARTPAGQSPGEQFQPEVAGGDGTPPASPPRGEALEAVDLHLPAGSVVAFVGENGAGKTTLVKLLCRFYDPSAGRILVDGTDLCSIAHDEWREKIAAGFQDFARFELTVQQSVGVGDIERLDDPAAATAALARAGSAELVDRLEGGLSAQLGRQWEGGQELSGGQWQKLAIARAFMRDSPLLLILDEPTSALDADTEHALFEGFRDASRRLGNGAITLIVSHRFSTVRMANLIVVMEAGRIREAGSHEDLMALGGLYAELYSLQARNYQ